jgi:hypothetical protein
VLSQIKRKKENEEYKISLEIYKRERSLYKSLDTSKKTEYGTF